jgi:hypothetical protein
MKNQYFGDINDYVKYSLLRSFAEAGLHIGICWMLTPNDGRSDGRKIAYLSKPEEWRDFDPFLFDSLSEAVTMQKRRVRYIQDSECLPNTSFFNSQVPKDQRIREKWLSKFLRKHSDADLLFFDPDNGIEVKSTSQNKKSTSKYLFWDEIQMAWTYGGGLLIFQHFCREERTSFVSRLVNRLKLNLPESYIMPIITPYVVYFLIYREHQSVKMRLGLDLISQRWRNEVRVVCGNI